jgi:3-dehydroquinate dehydratase II
MRLLVLNGPNLNLLGTRRPEIYGATTLPELEAACRTWAAETGDSASAFQSNHEGELIDRIHAARGEIDGIVFNPGAFTHTSYALHDAIEAVEIPVVELHISDVRAREPWRAVSVVGPACTHTIFGRGVEGYRWAIRHLHWNHQVPGVRRPYGPHPDQHVVMREPSDATGLVVLVHGGFWRATWGFDTIEGLAVDLHRAGFSTAVVEHRRAGRDHPGPGAMVDDVADAIDEARRATGFGGDRTAVVGHSAGAHLAALASVRAHPHLLVSLAGVLDLERGMSLGGGAAADFLAGAEPAAFSPIERVPFGVPVVVAAAAGDGVVPASQAEHFAGAAARAGDDVTVLEAPGDHYSFLDPGTEAWLAVRSALVERFRAR